METDSEGAIGWKIFRVFRAVYFFVGGIVILTLCYLYGHGMLEGVLGGNDTIWALSLVHWYNRWFPDLPIWFPLQGAGTPLLLFYPPGTTILSILINRLDGIAEVQALALVGLCSVSLTAIGIYLLVWVKLKNQTLALLAGIFYPLSSASWYWLTFMGMYAQAVSIMFFPYAFILFDLYINRSIHKLVGQQRLGQRLILPCAAIVFSFMFLTHGATAAVFLMAILLYSLLLGLQRTSSNGPRKRTVLRALRAACTGLGAGLGLTAFWALPFVRVMRLANREGLSEFAAHQIPFTDLLSMVGFGNAELSVFSQGLTFALPVVLFAAFGIGYSFFKRRQVFPLSILTIFFSLYTSLPGIWPGLVGLFAQLWAFTQARALAPTIVLLPAVAAYGVWGIPDSISRLMAKVTSLIIPNRFKQWKRNTSFRKLMAGLQVLTAVGIFMTAVIILQGYQPWGNQFSGYGPPGQDGNLPISFEDNWFSIPDGPNYQLSTSINPAVQDDCELINNKLQFDATVRFDNTPNFGGLTQNISLCSESSILNIYNYQSSIIHAMWGYQQGLFFGKSEADRNEINELAKWFGIQYVLLHRDLDSPDKYDRDLWQTIFPSKRDEPNVLEVRHFQESPPLASLLRSPRVLVIGGYKNAVYEQVFKTFAKGGISYDEALIVEGLHNIDEYSLKEITQFDVVLLHGYGYKNRDRAWGLLEQYVKMGGALFVDTGWQYWTPDWEMQVTPLVLPTDGLTWTNLPATEEYHFEGFPQDYTIDVNAFSPLIWQEQPWSVSVPSSGLREGANPLLKSAGKTLVASWEYGMGRVVWSGMNIIGHSFSYNNATEREFLRQLLAWLSSNQSHNEFPDLLVERDHPDHIRFLLDEPIEEGVSLLWREAYSPDWHASVNIEGQDVGISIYRAGPGMMLLALPVINEPGAVIHLDYNLGWQGWIGLSITLLTATVLILGAISPKLWSSIWSRVARDKERQSPEGRVEWLPGFGSQPSLPLEEESGLSDIDLGAKTETRKSIQMDITTDDGDDSDAQDLETLWSQLVESGKMPPPQNEDVNNLINWWRHSRSKPNNSS